jgi:deoxyribonuclease-4
MILGAHVSISGGIQKAPLNGREIGCDAIQIFSKNQVQWQAKPYTPEAIAEYKANLAKTGIRYVVIHDSYLINLCAPDPANLKKSLDGFTDELVRADQLGIPYVVTHPGSHLDRGEEWGIERIAASLNEIHERLPACKAMTLLETTAGQGSNLGYTFEQLALMREKVIARNRVGICADTCHMYSAGYDIKNPQGYRDTWKRFDDVIGLENLKVFHLNDTKKALGSRVDRHHHIGEGLLGLEPFRRLLQDPRFADLPGILETPGDLEDFARNLKLLRSLL